MAMNKTIAEMGSMGIPTLARIQISRGMLGKSNATRLDKSRSSRTKFAVEDHGG
jgi:hypothetical protein